MTDAKPATMAAALATLQTRLPHITKDSAALVPTKAGGAYGYKYADLATITRLLLPVMGELGLSFTACPSISDKGFVLAYVLHHTDGGELTGYYPLPATGTPQQIGSAITYARRYCLLAVTGAAPDDEDDDGQAAEQAASAAGREREALRRMATAPEGERVAVRLYEPEVDEHGAATLAEQTRMNRGPVPGTSRHSGTAENDPWYDSPKPLAELANPEDKPGSATDDQVRDITIRLTARGMTARPARLAWLAKELGLDMVRSTKDLSYTQAARALQAIDAAGRSKP